MIFSKSIIERLREQNSLLRDLPEQIELPTQGDRTTPSSKPLADATLDDVAFAVRVLRRRIEALDAPRYALQSLYEQARAEGALGAVRVADLPPLPSRYS